MQHPAPAQAWQARAREEEEEEARTLRDCWRAERGRPGCAFSSIIMSSSLSGGVGLPVVRAMLFLNAPGFLA